MAYKQLDFRKRCQISGLWRAGYSQTEIAKEIGVHKSTISRELNRNITFVRTKLGSWQYKPDYAQKNTVDRHKYKHKQIKFTKEIELFVREKILEDWSPDQISGYVKRHNLFSKGPIKNRRSIEERPLIVNEKTRIGDWEIDTIIGKQHQKAIVTLVDRVSKKTLIGQVGYKQASFVSAQTIRLLQSLKLQVFTITADNGSEFSQHEYIASALGAEVYFAHPYHSWERGLNENTNSLK